MTRTPNLLIWSQTRYHCAIGPLVETLRNDRGVSNVFEVYTSMKYAWTWRKTHERWKAVKNFDNSTDSEASCSPNVESNFTRPFTFVNSLNSFVLRVTNRSNQWSRWDSSTGRPWPSASFSWSRHPHHPHLMSMKPGTRIFIAEAIRSTLK